MELMDMSLENLYKRVFEGGSRLPEEIIGYIAVSVSFFEILLRFSMRSSILC